ncbi:transporter substrate-binding domain-containing protein [Thermosipho japonicus]|nr:transporter substrate-binding domain-containing protein [Thermosipho japonicus]
MKLPQNLQKYLGVNPEFKIVDKFSKYFENTIFNSIDMIADIITITEERSKTLTMIKFVEIVEILIGRKGEEITNIKDLVGKKIITFENFTYFKTLQKILNENNIDYDISNVTIKNNKLAYINKSKVSNEQVEILLIKRNINYSPYFLYLQLIENKADFTIIDSFSFVQKYFNTLFMKQNLKPIFPLTKEVEYLSFCFPKDATLLSSQFEKPLDYYKNSGKFDKLFKKYFNISYYEYLSIIGLIK